MKSFSRWFSRRATETPVRSHLRVALLVLVAVALVLSTVAPVTSPAAAAPKMKAQESHNVRAQFKFGDVDENGWEFQYVAEMKGKGVIKGYEDGTFRPNASINQAEALALTLRLLGLEEEAKASDSVAVKIPGVEATPWATGYVDLGLRMGLVNASEFQPNKAASRAWVTTLLTKALDLLDAQDSESDDGDEEDEQAQDEEAVLLSQFADLADLPATLRSAIAKALDYDLISGYPDKTFRPNKPVTRAEMAALLSRFDLRIPFPTSPYEVRGRVTAVDENSITIAPWWRDNPVVILPWLNQHTERQRHRVRTGNDAGFGENAQIILPILPILPTMPPVPEEKTYEVSEDASILKNGKPADLSDIAVGDDVRMLLNDEGVVILIVANGSLWWEVKGEVTKMSPSPESITVAMRVYKAEDEEDDDDEDKDEDEDGPRYVTKEHTFKVSEDVRVEYKDRVVEWSEIAVGDLVQMRLSGDEVVAIKILPEYRVIKGTVKSAPDDDLKLAIEDDDGDIVTLDVSVTAEVRCKGKTLDIADIKEGDEVKVVVERGAAILIEIKDKESEDEDESQDEEDDEKDKEDAEDEERDEGRENEFSGKVIAITLSSAKTWINVQDEDGHSKRFVLSADTEIELDGEDGDINDIEPGDEVTLTLDGNTVTKVVIED
ncbi:MAG TPA: S-layer homology domain-containing protein [Clostridia bacterium]|nr:S-layer homology domain-containing protein [Clostridia bacterium]